MTEDLYKDRRRIVPDATQSCSVSRQPCDKRWQGERKGCEVSCENLYSVGQVENLYSLLRIQVQLAMSPAAEKSFESILVAHPADIIANSCDFNKLK